MARDKKDYVALNCRLDREISERLDRYCDIKGQTKTLAVERILAEHFDAYDAAQNDPGKRTIKTI